MFSFGLGILSKSLVSSVSGKPLMSPAPESDDLTKRPWDVQGLVLPDGASGVCWMHSAAGFWPLDSSGPSSAEFVLACSEWCLDPGQSALSFNQVCSGPLAKRPDAIPARAEVLQNSMVGRCARAGLRGSLPREMQYQLNAGGGAWSHRSGSQCWGCAVY